MKGVQIVKELNSHKSVNQSSLRGDATACVLLFELATAKKRACPDKYLGKIEYYYNLFYLRLSLKLASRDTRHCSIVDFRATDPGSAECRGCRHGVLLDPKAASKDWEMLRCQAEQSGYFQV